MSDGRQGLQACGACDRFDKLK